MNKKLLTVVLAGAVFTMALMPALSNAGNGRTGGNQTKSTHQFKVRQQLKDGTCLNSGASGAGTMQQKGKTYGPGDGTGNGGVGPKDGSGYGATAKK